MRNVEIIDRGAPRDVLAAEEFVLPGPDPLLVPERLDLPSDLVGAEARSVLVAEEFAIPAPEEAHEEPMGVERRMIQIKTVVIIGGMTLVVVNVFRRLQRRCE
ncbi:MAG: hypothetical protein ACP5H2_09540 [Solirubrobacteraceae bacterium]